MSTPDTTGICGECGLPTEACNQLTIFRLAIRRALRCLETETVMPVARIDIAKQILKEAFDA